MARRAGRKGDYLITDDYFGLTTYASKVQKDYWGSLTTRPLKRNLQEIASPLNDPEPVKDFRGAAYEYVPVCVSELAPEFVGLTTVLTNSNNPAFQVLNLNPAIPDMSVGCTMVVR